MHVLALMATCGRHRCAERALTCFLEQDYEGEHTLLIHNNSPVEQQLSLPELPPNKKVILLNKSTGNDGGRYNSLGAIYNDTIQEAPKEVDIIIHWDDDDIYLPNHISAGVAGYNAMNKNNIAYKPAFSFFRHADGVGVVQNTLEPSIFVKASHIFEHGYSDTTSDQHMKWLSALEDKIFVDPSGIPTLVYNWGDKDIPTFKTSGNPDNPQNFDNYRNFSQEHGDLILSPIPAEDMHIYYQQIRQ